MKVSNWSQLRDSSKTSGSTVVAQKASIEFQSDHKGNYQALVPLAYMNRQDGAVDSVSCPVTVSSDTSRNSKGKRRVLIKVSMPYQAVAKQVTVGTAVGLDPARSGGEISAHIVISMPKSATEDTLGKNGDFAKNAAFAQVALVCKLLACFQGYSLMGQGELSFRPKVGASDGTLVPSFPIELKRIPSSGAVESTAGVEAYRTGSQPAMPLQITQDATYGAPGIRLPDIAALVHVVDDPLVRGINGLEPIRMSDEYMIPAAVSVNL